MNYCNSIKNIDDKRCFKDFNTIPLMEKYIEDLKKKLYEKYYIDYVGIHVLNNKSEYLISRLDHLQWHEYHWKFNKIRECVAIEHLSQLKMKENSILFFQAYQTSSMYDLRGEIIGKVSHGCSFLFTDEMSGNRIQFCITFQDNSSVNRLENNILIELIKDLSKVKGFLNPFMDYFVNVGNLAHSSDLERFVNTYPKLSF